METKDTVIVGLVVLLVLVVAFSQSLGTTGKSVKLTCSDTDSGDDRYVKGTITGIGSNGLALEKTDICVNKDIVKEYRCNLGQGDPGWQSVSHFCENGCSDGACIS